MSELADCINSLSAKDILLAATKKGPPFYINVFGLGGYCDAFQAVLDAYVPTIPDAVQLTAQNTMCCALVDAGIWDKLDLFYVFANGDSPNCLINWVNPGTFDATVGGILTFTAWEGLTGDGLSGYVNTGWKPSPDGVNHGLNTASFGLYQRNNASDSAYSCGVDSGANETWARIRYDLNDQFYARLNSGGGISIANLDSRGLFIVNRPDASNLEIHRNKSQLTSQALAVNGLPTDDFYIFRRNPTATYASSQFSMFFAGGALTTTDRDNFVDAFETYMDFLGKGVI